MRHGRTCPKCGSSVNPEQDVCGKCRHLFTSIDEEDEEPWDEDDIVSLTEKTEMDLDDEDDWDEREDSGGVIMEDDPNAERESFDGEQEDDWDPPLYDDDKEEGGEDGLDGSGDD